MSEHKYNEAYKKGIEKGRELARLEYMYSDYDEAYSQGRADAIEEVEDKASWIQEGLSGYYKITVEALEQLKEHKNEQR